MLLGKWADDQVSWFALCDENMWTEALPAAFCISLYPNAKKKCNNRCKTAVLKLKEPPQSNWSGNDAALSPIFIPTRQFLGCRHANLLQGPVRIVMHVLRTDRTLLVCHCEWQLSQPSLVWMTALWINSKPTGECSTLWVPYCHLPGSLLPSSGLQRVFLKGPLTTADLDGIRCSS